MPQGGIAVKACPSKLRPDCPPILANRNTMGPTDGGPVSRGLGVAGHTWRPGLILEKDPNALE